MPSLPERLHSSDFLVGVELVSIRGSMSEETAVRVRTLANRKDATVILSPGRQVSPDHAPERGPVAPDERHKDGLVLADRPLDARRTQPRDVADLVRLQVGCRQRLLQEGIPRYLGQPAVEGQVGEDHRGHGAAATGLLELAREPSEIPDVLGPDPLHDEGIAARSSTVRR